MRRVETEMDELEKNYDNNKILFLLLRKKYSGYEKWIPKKYSGTCDDLV